MAPDLVVIGSVILQNATQLRFVEHDQVIEAFATNRANQPLHAAFLPRRARRGRMIADTHCPNAMGVGWAEGPVAVAKQVTWPFVPRKGVGYLSGNPLGGWIGSHTNRD